MQHCFSYQIAYLWRVGQHPRISSPAFRRSLQTRWSGSLNRDVSVPLNGADTRFSPKNHGKRPIVCMLSPTSDGCVVTLEPPYFREPNILTNWWLSIPVWSLSSWLTTTKMIKRVRAVLMRWKYIAPCLFIIKPSVNCQATYGSCWFSCAVISGHSTRSMVLATSLSLFNQTRHNHYTYDHTF
jgi:hypothetical protein